MTLTPLRQQYLRIKRQHPDALLLFRLGDFYESFDEDAKVVADVCDIVLTSRPVGKGQRVPLAGVPYHAVESYISKLIEAGHKVAICEQVGESATKGLMLREVTRVITPGTVVEAGLLEDRRNNYLVSLVMGSDGAGLAYVDITTGEFATTEFAGGDIGALVQEELERLQPAELVVPDDEASSIANIPYAISPYDAWRFEYGNARNALLEHLGVGSLAGYGCDQLSYAVRAAGAIVQYLHQTQESALSHLVALSTYSTSSYMTLDVATRHNLELTETLRSGSSKGSLLAVLDTTRTPMGGRLLRRWVGQPLIDIGPLDARLSAVQALFDSTPVRTECRLALKRVGDMERMANRVAQGLARPRELLALRDALSVLPRLQEVLGASAGRGRDSEAETSSSDYPFSSDAWDTCDEVVDLIDRAISVEGGSKAADERVIVEGYSSELDQITAAARAAQEWVADLERTERRRTGIKSLKVGYNKVFGYYIEVTKPNLEHVPKEYVRKQTLVNAERFITPELKEKEAIILNAHEHAKELEEQIYREVCSGVAQYCDRIVVTAHAIAHLDVYASLAEIAQQNGYTRPELKESGPIDIRGGRHPVVELMLDAPYVPNDTHLGDDEQVLIITGPNMSGKSTYLRQVALIVLMAQIGSFVPADAATIGVVDRIFTRVGAQDQISAGQSTFMVEMIETANILNHATPRSLLVLDEIGRGTSTYDGISIAWAVAEYIHNHPRVRAKTLFATHYHELIELEKALPGVRNYNVAVVEEGDSVVFLHKIVPGGADRSYGIHVARLAGIPPSVVSRAEEILAELEGEGQRGSISSKSEVGPRQLPLFGSPSPVLQELKELDVMSLSPLEALNTLYELQQKAQG